MKKVITAVLSIAALVVVIRFMVPSNIPEAVSPPSEPEWHNYTSEDRSSFSASIDHEMDDSTFRTLGLRFYAENNCQDPVLSLVRGDIDDLEKHYADNETASEGVITLKVDNGATITTKNEGPYKRQGVKHTLSHYLSIDTASEQHILDTLSTGTEAIATSEGESSPLAFTLKGAGEAIKWAKESCLKE